VAATRTTARTITIELPDALVASLESLVGIEDRAWKALVLDFLRDGEISQGRAARLLGVTRYDILDLMASHHILSGPLTAEEAERDVEAARRGSRLTATDAHRQR
jgi:predicted HTH domain antitoxin